MPPATAALRAQLDVLVTRVNALGPRTETPLCLGIKLVPAYTVPLRARLVVGHALEVSRAELRLPALTTRWYEGDESLGFVHESEPAVVWLHRDLGDAAPERIAEVACHECSHAADFLARRPRTALSRRIGEVRAKLTGWELGPRVRPPYYANQGELRRWR